MELLVVVAVILAAAAAVFGLLAWRRPLPVPLPPPDLTPLLSRVDYLDRTLREELARNRQELSQAVDSVRNASGESFELVSARLEQVHRGLGEMQSLAAGVGDLRRLLSNVKTRGTWGEVQLSALLEQMLSPEQYERNFPVTGTSERVEFAVRMPVGDEIIWLPIDAKFPQEDYERLISATDPAGAEQAALQLERRIKLFAKEVSTKYIAPPRTTDYAVLFLPTEGLYAEVLRRPGLMDCLLRDCRVHITGPTTLGALLSTLRYGHQRLAIEKKAGEAWRVLGAAKTEFQKYADSIDKVRRKLEEATAAVDQTQVRTRAIQRSLRDVEPLPEQQNLALDETEPRA
ncbi:MAG TPA: DNA recombination protein RmuC [Bryobacteraceae bacterium]|nr:DNA recombination protein RmuC [Bryobacteraceae bacterium]